MNDDDVDLGMPSERLADEVTALAGHLAAATYRLLMMIRELDRRGAWAEWGCRSCAHWLNWQIGLDLRTGREHVRVAHRLDELSLVSAAFRAGTISYSKVRALCRIANRATEADLVMIARHGTAAHIERVAGAYRRSVALSAADAEAQHARRYAQWFWDDDGTFVFKARLPAEVGALVKHAIEEAMEPTRGPHDERAADAFAEIRRALTTQAGGHSDRYQVMVHVEPAALAGGEGECHLDNGPALAVETARRIGCDTATVVVTEHEGRVLDVGRKTRTIPASLRRALHVRDGGCRFPGCTSGRYTDGHHIQHWADGGHTNLDNLVLLCRHHHRLVHEGQWTLQTVDDAAGFTFVDTHGHELPARPPERRGNVKAVRHPRIDADTIRSEWGGETLDLNMAIESLRWHDDHPPPPNT